MSYQVRVMSFLVLVLNIRSMGSPLPLLIYSIPAVIAAVASYMSHLMLKM
jgi:hypothetical protein